MSDPLAVIWERADAEEPCFSGDEVAAWSDGLVERFADAGLVHQVENATSVVCDACAEGHVEDVTFIESPRRSPVRAYIHCPEHGRVRVPLDRLRQWEVDFGGRLITVRSANGAAVCVIDCQGAGRGFFFHSGETAAAVVEGFTITNGSAGYGGGMYNWQSSPTVTQCTFSGNRGDGGMYNWQGSPTVTHCTFSGNVGEDGGGMCNKQGSPTVTDCTFSGNTADVGGGMYNWQSSPTVTHCTFSGNTADYLGGGMCNW